MHLKNFQTREPSLERETVLSFWLTFARRIIPFSSVLYKLYIKMKIMKSTLVFLQIYFMRERWMNSAPNWFKDLTVGNKNENLCKKVRRCLTFKKALKQRSWLNSIDLICTAWLFRKVHDKKAIIHVSRKRKEYTLAFSFLTKCLTYYIMYR